MAVPVIDGANTIRIGTRTVAPTTVRPVAVSPVPASQPKNQLFQAVNGSVWRWNPQANQWQMVQSTPSVATPYAPQLVGTITKPIVGGAPGAFVTVKNVAAPTAPGEVFLPGASAPLIIPAGPDTTPTVPVVNNQTVKPPSHNVSYSPPPPPVNTAIFPQPAYPLGTPPIEPPQPPEISFTWPVLIVLALGAVLLFGKRGEA